jgi:hypothetical protein
VRAVAIAQAGDVAGGLAGIDALAPALAGYQLAGVAPEAEDAHDRRPLDGRDPGRRRRPARRDTRRKAAKWGAMGSTIRATKPG